MPKGSQFTNYVLDQLEEAGTIRSRSMFGGTGVYIDEVFCAIITSSGRFCLRVDDTNRPDYEAEGMGQFPGRGDSQMPYFEVPLHVLEDAEELRTWTRKARQAAVAASSSKKPRAKKARSQTARKKTVATTKKPRAKKA